MDHPIYIRLICPVSKVWRILFPSHFVHICSGTVKTYGCFLEKLNRIESNKTLVSIYNIKILYEISLERKIPIDLFENRENSDFIKEIWGIWCSVLDIQFNLKYLYYISAAHWLSLLTFVSQKKIYIDISWSSHYGFSDSRFYMITVRHKVIVTHLQEKEV